MIMDDCDDDIDGEDDNHDIADNHDDCKLSLSGYETERLS